MSPLTELEVLFFKAEKVFLNPPAKYYVGGYASSRNSIHYFKEYKKDFFFRTYKEVIVAGLLWSKHLFGATSIEHIYIKELEIGKKKQWFNVQLVHTDNGVIIDGEKFNPYINIAYSYDAVTKVKFEIGFYRYACENGLIYGFKELSKMEIKTENLFDVPFWLNPCLVKLLTKKFEFQIKVLKNTSVKGEQIQNWIEKNVSKWNISKDLIFKYIEELGENAYALLNILSDRASNFQQEVEYERLTDNFTLDYPEIQDNSSNSERATRQRKIGQFLESLVEEILKENDNDNTIIDINSPSFKINDDNISLLETVPLRSNYKFDIGKISFE